MTISAYDQLFLELVNRARLDPAAEAARGHYDLNGGLPAGTLNASARQVLAFNTKLDVAAETHTKWMLQADVFNHIGQNGTTPDNRIAAAGYTFSDPGTLGENIAWMGRAPQPIDAIASVDALHSNLFGSPEHRLNILNDTFREIGIGYETGVFTSRGTNWNAAIATEDFARSGNAVFVTGVVYNDTNKNDFYSIGEGISGTRFAVGSASTTSQTAGGYSLATTAGLATVTVQHGSATSVVKMDLTPGNGKLDLVDSDHFLTSSSLQLVSGVANATLLGVADLTLTGNKADNHLIGNSGDNKIVGGNGADTLNGGAGDDRLLGNLGADWLDGGSGNDSLRGGLGADHFVMNDHSGSDRIFDFSVAQHDRLVLDDALWENAGLTAEQVIADFSHMATAGLVFDFGGGDVLTLLNVTSTTGLAAQFDIV